MFKLRIGILLGLSIFALSACGGSGVSPGTSSGTPGNATSAVTPAAPTITLPSDFPVPVYSGAKIVSVDRTTDQYTGGPITMVAYNAINDVKVVREWYESELPKLGWTIRPNIIEQDNGHVTMVADKGTQAVTIGLYPKFEPNGDARYSLIVEPKK